MRAQVWRAYPFGLHEDQRGGRAFCTQKWARAPQPLPNCTGRSGRLNGDQTLPRWSGLKIQAAFQRLQNIRHQTHADCTPKLLSELCVCRFTLDRDNRLCPAVAKGHRVVCPGWNSVDRVANPTPLDACDALKRVFLLFPGDTLRRDREGIFENHSDVRSEGDLPLPLALLAIGLLPLLRNIRQRLRIGTKPPHKTHKTQKK